MTIEEEDWDTEDGLAGSTQPHSDDNTYGFDTGGIVVSIFILVCCGRRVKKKRFQLLKFVNVSVLVFVL